MAFDSNNKIVLITGSSSGIGKSLAVEFANKNAKVALTGRDENRLENTKKHIQKNNGCVEIFPFDLNDISLIPNLVNEIEKFFDSNIALLVNNAGVTASGLVEDTPMEVFADILQVNYFAPLALCKAVIPGMKRKRSGQIINITSGCGIRALPGSSAYSVSKFALNALTESLRLELIHYGIEVILFSPGQVATGISMKSKSYGKIKSSFDKGYKSSPDKVAQEILSASAKSKKTVTLSFRNKILYHLNYWLPGLVDLILQRMLIKDFEIVDKKQN
jgi:dehydrogenase/reductase SDR family member 7B